MGAIYEALLGFEVDIDVGNAFGNGILVERDSELFDADFFEGDVDQNELVLRKRVLGFLERELQHLQLLQLVVLLAAGLDAGFDFLVFSLVLEPFRFCEDAEGASDLD